MASTSGPDRAPSFVSPTLSTLAALPLGDAGDADAIVYGPLDAPSVTLCHADLRHCVRSYAAASIVPTSTRGDTIAILLPNGPDFVVAFLAVAHSGCTAAPLNPKYTTEELEFYLSDANVSRVIVDYDTPDDAPVRLACARLGSVAVMPLPKAVSDPTWHASRLESLGIPSTDHVLQARQPTPSDTALFLHTSGTTSRPKGVPLSHKNLCVSATNIARTYKLTAVDRTVLVMPLFHVHGLMSATLATLATSGTIAIPPGGRFSASSFWPLAVRSRATWFTAVPTIHQILLARADVDYPRDAPPPLRFVRSCSASLAPAVLQKMLTTFGAPVLEAYAMTEAAHQMTANPLPEVGPARPGTVGVPQNVDVAILNAENAFLPPGQVGEVCIRGENVTAGYQNNPEANAVAFAGGWFHTGDQGVLDADGYLRLTGRLKELINRGGEKISPLEVDAALLSHCGVTEAVSFGVPDEKYGEEVNAAVILKGEFVGKVSEVDLTSFAKEKLTDFKIPKRFFICTDLPRTATGKIQRRIVSKHFLDQLGSS